LLSQEEARFSLIPTLRTTLGVKGHRPLVGNMDCHAYVYLFGTLKRVTGQLPTRLVERPRKAPQAGIAKQRDLQKALAAHLRDIARAYPATQYAHVVLVVDNASGHQGIPIAAGLKAFPHLALFPLPSYSPQLQVIERFWKVLRRRATPHRLFPTMAHLQRPLRTNLCYDQTLRHRLLSVIQAPRKRSKSPAA
jgi:hypothetical protein